MHFSIFARMDEKIYKRLKCVSIKSTNVNMQKCIWRKFFGKGVVRMDQGFHRFWNTPKEFENSCQNKAL
jgi:hypothetical protein